MSEKREEATSAIMELAPMWLDCRNCGRSRDRYHLDGRCLFGPSMWLCPKTLEELKPYEVARLMNRLNGLGNKNVRENTSIGPLMPWMYKVLKEHCRHVDQHGHSVLTTSRSGKQTVCSKCGRGWY